MINSESRFEEFPVQASDIANADALGADILALALVAAVTKAILVHQHDHIDSPLLGFHFTLRQQRQLGDFGREEQHRSTIRAGGGAGSTADASGSIHSLFRNMLRDEDGITVLG